MGKLLGIAYRDGSRQPMREIDAARISPGAGVATDFRGRKPGPRQVTVLCAEKWRAACDDLGTELPWTTRRANLLVNGLSIGPECVGRTLRVGTALLRITIETDPCSRMDEQYKGLKRALMPDWRGGACCEVVQDGDITVGDTVQFVN
jgi:MOSC domain-containing protein YiiM